MHSGSFIANTPTYELDDFRKEVRGKINSKFDQPKHILYQPKTSNLEQLQQILRSSISPKSPKNNPLHKSQNSSPQAHKSPGRLSFQRSSLDLSKPTQKQQITTMKYIISKKTIARYIATEQDHRIAESNQKSQSSYQYYFLELKKLAKVVLRETQG
ncbi:unnamed protein product (macronuclear) [Paramecium tetraurelia]|uniref:Uncharacterized protein n=1 Tax=Paramecium tetraurelia TaxID=5888 RepID=A0CN36_PARTE|nr:uncharacterized protein GSPATT00008644001 [Paramecium tetraurelia]CAK72203.1 unnamed protein product [Paramecium tetraurelia]|eukprot:XP_001439600.1 hypothetical protein (macronuclear) [Paramecium tetraurelia strain d4-2]